MLRLREKAHISLAAFKNSPPTRNGSIHGPLSEPSTPADDNDELATLGGRTRLVAQKEKSLSPSIADRSPTSLNPIVPLPLSRKGVEEQNAYHPHVVQYLQTFSHTPGQAQAMSHQQQQMLVEYAQHQQHQQQHQQHQHQHQPQQQQSSPTSYEQQQQFLQQQQEMQMHQQVLLHQHQQQQQHSQQTQHELHPITTSFVVGSDGMGYAPMVMPGPSSHLSPQAQTSAQGQLQNGVSFPQYFPVFDYGNVGGADMFIASPQTMEGELSSSRSYSPESTMQNVWQDFVEQIQT